MPTPTTTATAVKIGFDEEEYGTVTISEDGASFEFAGPNVDALKDYVRHYAEVLARKAKDDNALKGIKPPMILALMLENMQGRAWAVEAGPGEDDPNLADEDEDPAPVDGEESEEEAPAVTNAYAFTDTGLLIPTGNVFCATGAGGGVDPSCSPGGPFIPKTGQFNPDTQEVHRFTYAARFGDVLAKLVREHKTGVTIPEGIVTTARIDLRYKMGMTPEDAAKEIFHDLVKPQLDMRPKSKTPLELARKVTRHG